MPWECEPPKYCPDGGKEATDQRHCSWPSFGSAGSCQACHELWPQISRLWRIIDEVWDPSEDSELPSDSVVPCIQATVKRDLDALERALKINEKKP